jgi:hypothetical protein
VENEETIRAHAMFALHEPVTEVANSLGVNGNFYTPSGGNAAIIGAPDFSWVVDSAWPHPKLVVPYQPLHAYVLLLKSTCVGRVQNVVGSRSGGSARCPCTQTR